jgi:hypothetical protein
MIIRIDIILANMFCYGKKKSYSFKKICKIELLIEKHFPHVKIDHSTESLINIIDSHPSMFFFIDDKVYKTDDMYFDKKYIKRIFNSRIRNKKFQKSIIKIIKENV